MHAPANPGRPLAASLCTLLTCWFQASAQAQETHCKPEHAQQIENYNKEALESLEKNETEKGWRIIRKAILEATQAKCLRHKATATAYLLLGVVEFRAGRKEPRLKAWRKAIQIDPSITMPPVLKDPRLNRDFQSVRAYLLKLPSVQTAILCTFDVLRNIETLNNEAFTNMMVNDRPAARQKIDLAMAVAFKNRCHKKRVVAKTYLILGFLEYLAGRTNEKMTAWRRALRLNPRVALPWNTMPSRLTFHFKAVRDDILESRSGSGGTAAPSVPVGGCARDTDCKGRRICHRGRCVYPTGGPESPDVSEPGAGTRVRRGGRGKRFSDKGTAEVGGVVGFAWSSTTLKYEGEKSTMKVTGFDIDLYVGYFPANRFALGLYVTFPISQTKQEILGMSSKSKSIDFGLLFALGFAVPLGKPAALYGDALIGFVTGTTESDDMETGITMGAVGAELGLKFPFARHCLLRIGFRPTYWFGKAEAKDSLGETKFKASAGDIKLRAGFSAYF